MKKKNFGEQKQVRVKDGTVKIQLVRSEENVADPFTEKLSNGPFESLASRYVNFIDDYYPFSVSTASEVITITPFWG